MSSKKETPSYGVIDHYVGEKGKTYFSWQETVGTNEGQYNLHFWQPYIEPTDDVLDFGCGGGFLLHNLRAQRKAGVEINPHAREHAQQLGIEMYPVVAETRGLFDKIITSHALEHIPHPRQAVLELKEKLRPDGRLLMLLPIDDWRSRSNRHYDATNQNMHLHTWTPQLLGNLLVSCGLRICELRVVTHAWPPGRHRLWNLSPRLFHAAAYCWSILNKQRQLFAAAALPEEDS
ncbi:MAG: class I SAM-dependent methyltransferase [Rhodothermales bacterium]